MTFSATTTFDVRPTERELETRRKFARWLPDVVADRSVHARFVNTLSMLEHIGSVKIARTQSGLHITGDVLEHLAEETRHAYYLKRLARRIDDAVSDRYDEEWLLAGSSARVYFAKLDVEARRFSRQYVPADRRRAAAYLLVSWLVERRAMWLYPAYQEVLEPMGRGFSVRSIVAEETEHLAEMTEGLERLGLTEHPALPGLVAREEELFARFADILVDGR